MSTPGGPPARTGRILADWGPRDIPRTRPPKPVPIDLDALAEFDAGVERARAAYYASQPAGPVSPYDYDRRNALNAKRTELLRRQKEREK